MINIIYIIFYPLSITKPLNILKSMHFRGKNMKLNKVPLIASLLTAGALLFTPKISHSLDGIVMNSITNDPIPNAIVKLYQGEELLDSTRTDEEGYYRVSPNSVKIPDYNINLPSLE